MIREVFTTPKFTRDARRWTKMHPQSKAVIAATLDALSADAFQPALGTHKLKGKLSAFLACSAGYDIRIVFEFIPYKATEAIQLIMLGTHEQVYN